MAKLREKTANMVEHPCYDQQYACSVGRIHLPVALKCNMQCNYCFRNYSCHNDSRPGVCSRTLKPSEITKYLDERLKKHPEIKIIGIAGPAEPMADIVTLEETLKILKKHYSNYKLCMATNGLLLADNFRLIKDYEIDFLTITINAVTLEFISQIYEWISYKDKVYKEYEAARIIQEKQSIALKKLYDNSIKFKVNTIFIPGINDKDIVGVAKQISRYKAMVHNIVPLISVPECKFASIEPVRPQLLESIRRQCSEYLKEVNHCKQCRADAVGLL